MEQKLMEGLIFVAGAVVIVVISRIRRAYLNKKLTGGTITPVVKPEAVVEEPVVVEDAVVIEEKIKELKEKVEKAEEDIKKIKEEKVKAEKVKKDGK